MSTKKVIKTHTAQLTSISDKKAVDVEIEDLARLREIRALVEANNQSSLPTELVICQIYMESRFDKNARSDGSSARGLMQLLRAPIRELIGSRTSRNLHASADMKLTSTAKRTSSTTAPRFWMKRRTYALARPICRHSSRSVRPLMQEILSAKPTRITAVSGTASTTAKSKRQQKD